MSAAVHRFRSDYEIEMERTRFFVPLRYTLTVLSILAALALWGIYKVIPAVIDYIDVPVVYTSYSTDQITRVEIGDRAYTPDTDGEWGRRVKEVMSERHERIYVK